MIRLIVATIALSLSTTVCAQKDGPFDFKGIPLGASKAELLRANSWFRCTNSAAGRESCHIFPDLMCRGATATDCMKSMTYGGLVFKSVSATLIDDRLVMLSVRGHPNAFDRLRDTLIEAYGRPGTVSEETLKTGAGVELKNDKYRWSRGDTHLWADRYSGDSQTTLVRIVSNAGLEELANERRTQVKAGAKDL